MITKSSANNTFIRPQMFYIIGLQEMPFAKCFYIFLSIVYILTMFFNGFIIVFIYFEQSLHSAKYIAVSHLALADLCSSTAIIPKVIDTFLFNSNFITYEACLANMFFVHFSSAIQSLSLVILAYDRLIAICLPLQYHSINTCSRMKAIIVSIWLFCAALVSVMVLLITRLSFCQSTVINSFFCDHGPVYRLACNDFSPNIIMALITTALLLFLPMVFILFSYIAIGIALLKIASAEGRQKAIKTCVSHMILVAIFYFPLVVIYGSSQFVNFHPNARILNSSLSSTIPPMINPLIYTLKTEEMMDAIKNHLKRKLEKQSKPMINIRFLYQ
ncbi:olfactory receptor 1M1-like [Polypterus senegalus]|uniref:olfactory receptor 1M1-like n=1 Tax=Polypterus senegalus TaxID=55291 RepID=UPI001964D38B|nr:olfactory receptor 1M1-like [Polypterus senegalus]